LHQEKESCKNFLVVEEKIIRQLMHGNGCTLLTKIFVPRPSDVGRGMLVCGGVAVDLSEFVFGDSLIFNNPTIVT
jgi:hypothetical protein